MRHGTTCNKRMGNVGRECLKVRRTVLTLDKPWQNGHWWTHCSGICSLKNFSIISSFTHLLAMVLSSDDSSNGSGWKLRNCKGLALYLGKFGPQSATRLSLETPTLSYSLHALPVTACSEVAPFLPELLSINHTNTCKASPRSCCYHIQVSQRVLNQARTSKVSAKLEWFHEEFETAGASIVPSAGLCEFLSENFLISVISAYLSFVAVNWQAVILIKALWWVAYEAAGHVLKESHIGQSFSEFWDVADWRVERVSFLSILTRQLTSTKKKSKESDGLEAGKETARHTANISPSTFSTKL